MKRFSLEIRTDNEAFTDDPPSTPREYETKARAIAAARLQAFFTAGELARLAEVDG